MYNKYDTPNIIIGLLKLPVVFQRLSKFAKCHLNRSSLLEHSKLNVTCIIANVCIAFMYYNIIF